METQPEPLPEPTKVKLDKPEKPQKSGSHVTRKARKAHAGYWTGAHTTHRLRYHLVWIPKYRKRVLEGTIATRLTQLLHEGCQVNSWEVHELSVQPDHIHLLIQISARESVSAVVQILKGGTSKQLRLEFADLKEFLWGKSFWAAGYFAESVGVHEESVVRRYIRNQRSSPKAQESV